MKPLPFFFIFSLMALFSCQKTIKNKKSPAIKNIILLIGDGMGFQQLNLGNLYLGYAPQSPYEKKTLSLFKHSSHLSMSLVKPHGKLVVDSACSATQLSTGEEALSETIGVNYQGEKPQTILEMAKSKGMSTGLISNVRLTHATPASFAAHTTSRHNENEIAKLMLETDVDIMVSGGLRHFLPRNYKGHKDFQKKWKPRLEKAYGYSSKRKDNHNLLDLAENKGYEVIFKQRNFKKSSSSKILALLSNSQMPFAIDLNKNDISTPELTTMALHKLDKNPKGFFLMVEEGLIDWAGHANDAGSMLHEVLQMDKTYEHILKWAKGRDDTLIIVTADHETGGFGFSYKNKDIHPSHDFPGQHFPSRKFKPVKHYGTYQQLDQLFNQKKSLGAIFNKELRNNLSKESLCQSIKTNLMINLPLNFCEDIIIEAKYLSGLSKKQIGETMHLEYHHNFSNRGTIIQNILAKALAPYQNITWGTGAHTSTPVGVFITGNKELNSHFPPVMTHAQLGQIMKSFLR